MPFRRYDGLARTRPVAVRRALSITVVEIANDRCRLPDVGVFHRSGDGMNLEKPGKPPFLQLGTGDAKLSVQAGWSGTFALTKGYTP
jgi:hypothetical protein